MSNSKLILVKETKEAGIEFKPMNRLQIQEECNSTLFSEEKHASDQLDHEHQHADQDHKGNINGFKNFKKPLLGEFNASEDGNDGFRTPTSREHKIPVTKNCPPAPTKPETRVERVLARHRVKCCRMLCFED